MAESSHSSAGSETSVPKLVKHTQGKSYKVTRYAVEWTGMHDLIQKVLDESVAIETQVLYLGQIQFGEPAKTSEEYLKKDTFEHIMFIERCR